MDFLEHQHLSSWLELCYFKLGFIALLELVLNIEIFVQLDSTANFAMCSRKEFTTSSTQKIWVWKPTRVDWDTKRWKPRKSSCTLISKIIPTTLLWCSTSIIAKCQSIESAQHSIWGQELCLQMMCSLWVHQLGSTSWGTQSKIWLPKQASKDISPTIHFDLLLQPRCTKVGLKNKSSLK